MNDKIRDLQRQIEADQSKISNCKHTWCEAYYDPETTKEPYGYRTEKQGSDVWGMPEGYRDVTKDRWSRKCTKCGHVEHTYTQEAVIKEYKPKF